MSSTDPGVPVENTVRALRSLAPGAVLREPRSPDLRALARALRSRSPAELARACPGAVARVVLAGQLSALGQAMTGVYGPDGSCPEAARLVRAARYSRRWGRVGPLLDRLRGEPGLRAAALGWAGVSGCRLLADELLGLPLVPAVEDGRRAAELAVAAVVPRLALGDLGLGEAGGEGGSVLGDGLGSGGPGGPVAGGGVGSGLGPGGPAAGGLGPGEPAAGGAGGERDPGGSALGGGPGSGELAGSGLASGGPVAGNVGGVGTGPEQGDPAVGGGPGSGGRAAAGEPGSGGPAAGCAGGAGAGPAPRDAGAGRGPASDRGHHPADPRPLRAAGAFLRVRALHLGALGFRVDIDADPPVDLALDDEGTTLRALWWNGLGRVADDLGHEYLVLAKDHAGTGTVRHWCHPRPAAGARFLRLESAGYRGELLRLAPTAARACADVLVKLELTVPLGA